MAKIINEETELGKFNDVVRRSKCDKFYLKDNIIIGKTKNNVTLLFICDDLLKDKVNLNYSTIDLNDLNNERTLLLVSNCLTDNWIQIQPETDMNLSKIFSIKCNKFNYDISINRGQMPFKLLKSEYMSLYYTITDKLFIIKKRYESKLNGFGFSVIRGFQYI